MVVPDFHQNDEGAHSFLRPWYSTSRSTVLDEQEVRRKGVSRFREGAVGRTHCRIIDRWPWEDRSALSLGDSSQNTNVIQNAAQARKIEDFVCFPSLQPSHTHPISVVPEGLFGCCVAAAHL